MDMEKFMEELLNRFCKLDGQVQATWIEEYSDTDLCVVARENLNEFFRVTYSDNFIAFFETFKIYEKVWNKFDPRKKWTCVSDEMNLMESTDDLREVACNYCNLLSDFRYSNLGTLLGYTDEEVDEINDELTKIPPYEIIELWNGFQRKVLKVA